MVGFLSTIWVLPVFGQSGTHHEDVIYLVNKGRYRGEILDWDQEGRVKIRTWSGLVVDVPTDMIRRVVQKRVAGSDPRFSNRAFYHGVALGFGSTDSDGALLMDVQTGYAFHRLALFGLSTGVHVLSVGDGLQCLPLMAEWRAYPFQRRLSPYVAMRGGVCFPWTPDDWQERQYRTSYTGNAVAGLQVGQIGETSILLETGYQFNRIHSERSWVDSKGNSIVHRRSELYQRWILKLGVIF